jgi:hypothetical protein
MDFELAEEEKINCFWDDWKVAAPLEPDRTYYVMQFAFVMQPAENWTAKNTPCPLNQRAISAHPGRCVCDSLQITNF